MWVKVCGLQTMKAALAACEAGADALGFILAPSRRQVDPDRLRGLLMGLPPEVPTVGVFVDESPERIREIAQHTGLRVVQLHGAEPPEAIARVGVPVIKALRVKHPEDLKQLPLYREAAGLLLDPFVEGQHGGTGQRLDLALFREAAAVLAAAGIVLAGPGEPLTMGRPRLILAGGLTPQTVGEAIALAAPGGVDVSSGVETAGEKDIMKIYEFVEKAKGASA